MNVPTASFKVKWTGYLVFTLLLAAPLVGFTISTFRYPHSGAWHSLVICLLMLVGVFSWMAAMRIELFEDRLKYRTLLKKNEVLFVDMRRVEMSQSSFLNMSVPAILIYDVARYASKPLRIHIGAFRIEDMKRLTATLKEKKPA